MDKKEELITKEVLGFIDPFHHQQPVIDGLISEGYNIKVLRFGHNIFDVCEGINFFEMEE